MGNGDAELAFASSLQDQTLEGSGRTLVPRLRGNAPAKEVDLNPVDLPKVEANLVMCRTSNTSKASFFLGCQTLISPNFGYLDDP